MGCTIYKSSDRDSFNQNPLAGAPASFAAALGAEECWIASDPASSLHFDSGRVIIHERRLICAFDPSRVTSESRAQVDRMSEQVTDLPSDN